MSKKLGMVGCGTTEIMFRTACKKHLGKLPGVVGIGYEGKSVIVRVRTEEDGEALPKYFLSRRVLYKVVGTISKRLSLASPAKAKTRKAERDPLIIQYTNVIHASGGPNSPEARAFYKKHSRNLTFRERAKVLNKVAQAVRAKKKDVKSS